jgi:hypothetical protein
MEIWLPNSDPSGGGVAFSGGIHPGGQHFKVHSFVGTGFPKRFCQEWNQGLELVRTEQLPRRRFFSEPSERKPLLLTERKGCKDRREFF